MTEIREPVCEAAPVCKPTFRDDPMLIIIPTFNERENIEPLTQRLLAMFPDVHIVVVDDDSPDGTGRWCDDFAKNEKRFAVIHRQERLGIGAATFDGLRFGLEQGHDWIATMDGDGSHDPEHLIHVVSKLSDSEPKVFIGSRYCTGGTIESWPAHRRLASRMVNGASRMILRVPVSDYSSAFRVYHRSTLESIELDSIRSLGYAYLEEILAKLFHAGVEFEEFPICFSDRQQGESKASLKQTTRAILDLGRLFALRR